MKQLVSGSNGLVGKALVARFQRDGHEVHTLVRRLPEGEREIHWNPGEGELASDRLEGFDSVVHLAGESIAEGRWTEAKMKRIRDSRVLGTRLLCERLAALRDRPAVLICASAVGFYGDRANELLDERSEPGSGFLADVCREWEAATELARQAGIRVVNLRLGVVLSKDGGALAKMLMPFKLGVGGRIGSGRQWMSWIELDDLVDVIRHAISTDSLHGAVNAVSPEPVTNAEYTKTLGRVLRRPTVLPMPALGARLAFGKMADDLLLASTRVEARSLREHGFQHSRPELEGALRYVLGGGSS